MNINPLDYDSYYKAGQIFMIKEDYEQALSSFNTVLNINGQHVPSLLLAANILSENGDKENAIKYLEAAKQILEINEQDSGDVYDSIIKGLADLGANTEAEESDTTQTESTQPADTTTTTPTTEAQE
ncbi:hypothetical protein A2400_00180 [candidate division WS6 bacterium RIFOXYB1_FULL_33_14]|uniref:Uncharacterized protein n=1 Tax=candidate division WS6 bacterium RIFOXYB1_FULL_33_14 TaxID=1817896 RepID=A0A1F4UH43_9BACT|nr:MAG: hypothetical protein A2400_00180 [candidate division WS6 bacterium RIFOXYB1_FULL_33_14]